MAGIWDRVVGGVEDRANVTLVGTALSGVTFFGLTQAAALAQINTDLVVPLDAAAQTDLQNIITQFGTGSTTNKLVYDRKLAYALNSAELNLIDEATFRSTLNIA